MSYDSIKRCSARTLYQHGKTVTDTKKVLEDLLEHHHIETNPAEQKSKKVLEDLLEHHHIETNPDEQQSNMTQSGMY